MLTSVLSILLTCQEWTYTDIGRTATFACYCGTVCATEHIRVATEGLSFHLFVQWWTPSSAVVAFLWFWRRLQMRQLTYLLNWFILFTCVSLRGLAGTATRHPPGVCKDRQTWQTRVIQFLWVSLFMFLCVFALGCREFGCKYQCYRLPRMTVNLHCIMCEWHVKHGSLTHSFTHSRVYVVWVSFLSSKRYRTRNSI